MKELYTNSVYEPFNSGWQFTPPEGGDVQNITLPHGWNTIGWTYDEDENTAPSGTGIYEKILPGNALEGYTVKFEGVSFLCRVFLNGELLAENIGAHKAFEIELKNLKSDSNILTVEVTDKESAPMLEAEDSDAFKKSPRYTLWQSGMGSSLKAGGIWRNVWLKKPQESYIEPFVIENDGEAFEIYPKTSGDIKDCEIRISITDENGTSNCTAPADCKRLILKPIVSIQTFPLKPHLYELKSELYKNGILLQTITQPATLFRLEVRNSEFKVNNHPYYLRGQNGFPHCNVHHDKEYIKKYVDMVCSQGVEISRFHTEPPSHAWLDECDRRGIMVILEMPIHGSFGCYPYGHSQFDKNALSETLSIIEEYRRHPSIAIWSMGNELIVACERDLGLGSDLFDILERWIKEVRRLDSRPVISNSNGDAANIVNKSVGDIDDIHQYGGWYVENLYDLRHFGEYTMRNDMLFQPAISTESIASYTDNLEQCFIKNDSDVRQRKIAALRYGKITNLAKQSAEYQAFMLKEYAEVLWRLRREDSSFSGYIPFGQYTWFFNPFDKDNIKPKSIWTTYKKVMSPVHVQFECFSRHVAAGGYLCGTLGLWNEDIHLENDEFTIKIMCGGKCLAEKVYSVPYHKSHKEAIEIGPLSETGRIDFEVYYENTKISHNDIEFKVYDMPEISQGEDTYIYDPENMLDIGGKRIKHLSQPDNDCRLLVVGPYSMDRNSLNQPQIADWVENGGKLLVLEQNPGAYSEDMFGTGISSLRVCQPQWSRWAMNLVKHADRADICDEGCEMFAGLCEDDIKWWNGDTFVADSYLISQEPCRILSQVGNGLASTELMPVEYEYQDSGYSITALERSIGQGSVVFTSLLIGTKYKYEPVAAKILENLLK